MTLLERLSECNKRIKQLQLRVHQLEKSRERWRTRATGYRWENQELRRSVKRTRAQRDAWKWTTRRAYQHPPEWKNVHLSERDVQRILEIPVRP